MLFPAVKPISIKKYFAVKVWYEWANASRANRLFMILALTVNRYVNISQICNAARELTEDEAETDTFKRISRVPFVQRQNWWRVKCHLHRSGVKNI